MTVPTTMPRPTLGVPERRVLIAAAVLAGTLGLLLGRATVDPRTLAASSGRPPVLRATPRSAVAAALHYLDALRWDVLVDVARRRRVIRSLADRAAARRLETAVATQAEPVAGAVRVPPVVARPAVIGYRVDRFARERARVSVWGFVLFATGAYEPATQWSTSRVELVWRSGRWLVTDVRSHGGPSPDSSLGALAGTTRRFEQVDCAA